MSRRGAIALAWAPVCALLVASWMLSSAEAPPFSTAAFPFRDRGAHFVEHGLLAFAIAHACLRTFEGRSALRVGLFAVWATGLWGLLDEIHQAFVPGRSPDVVDLLADVLGALAGASLRTLLTRAPARPPPPSVPPRLAPEGAT